MWLKCDADICPFITLISITALLNKTHLILGVQLTNTFFMIIQINIYELNESALNVLRVVSPIMTSWSIPFPFLFPQRRHKRVHNTCYTRAVQL
jgi:hypothetical protein